MKTGLLMVAALLIGGHSLRSSDDWVVVPKDRVTRLAGQDRAEGGFNGGPNFFPRAAGVYNGLIAPEELIPERSGYFQIALSSYGRFSGRFGIGDNTVPVRGWFNSRGLAGVSIYKRMWDDCHCFRQLVLMWSVEFDLVADSDEIEGTVVNEYRGGWSADAYGLKAGYAWSRTAAPQSGRYTLRLPGAVDPVTAPPGDGFGAVTVSPRGLVKLSGRLPDGVNIEDSAYLSEDGYWPLYVPLNRGEGLLFGWLQFNGGEITGDLSWSKPARNDRAHYPEGFEGTVSARGGRFAVAGGSVSPFTWDRGQLQASDGNLGGVLGNELGFLSPSRLTDFGDDLSGLKIRVNSRTGLFSGSFLHPITGRSTAFAGGLFQFEDAGGGYFLGMDQGGTIRFTESGIGAR